MMLILGIETSCDDTSAAVVTSRGEVLSSVVSSQTSLHEPLGGVVPEIASRAHLARILPVLREALEKAGSGLESIDGVAVTRGPGLIGALLVGVQTAKALAFAIGKPVVGVNHLAGHMAAPFLRDGDGQMPPEHPFVALVASGGHTSLFVVHAPGRMGVLGRTRDDAAGEALDKGAKLLGLGYPGGPAIEKLAQGHRGPVTAHFARGLGRQGVLDFSFSGLKTALAARIRSEASGLDAGTRASLAFAYQEAVVDSLVTKSIRACEVANLRSLVVCGGVAANSRLREAIGAAAEASGIALHVPPVRYCTDNAAMIALAGAPALLAGRNDCMALAATPYLPSPED